MSIRRTLSVFDVVISHGSAIDLYRTTNVFFSAKQKVTNLSAVIVISVPYKANLTLDEVRVVTIILLVQSLLPRR